MFSDGANHFRTDGFHRFHANRRVGARTIRCDVHAGTLLEARRYAHDAYQDHGLRRSNDDDDDKHPTPPGALVDAPDSGDVGFAKPVGVSQPAVGAVRRPDMADRHRSARSDGSPQVKSEVTSGSKAALVEVTAERHDADLTIRATSDVGPDTPPPMLPSLEVTPPAAHELTNEPAHRHARRQVLTGHDPLAALISENQQLRAEGRHIARAHQRADGGLAGSMVSNLSDASELPGRGSRARSPAGKQGSG